MNTGTEVYVIESAKIDSLTIPQGVLLYKAKVEDYNKDKVLIVVKDNQQRSLMKHVPKETVHESYQKALEAMNAIVRDNTNISTDEELEETK